MQYTGEISVSSTSPTVNTLDLTSNSATFSGSVLKATMDDAVTGGNFLLFVDDTAAVIAQVSECVARHVAVVAVLTG